MGFEITYPDGWVVIVRGLIKTSGDYIDFFYSGKLITRINSLMEGVKIKPLCDIPENTLFEKRNEHGQIDQFIPVDYNKALDNSRL